MVRHLSASWDDGKQDPSLRWDDGKQIQTNASVMTNCSARYTQRFATHSPTSTANNPDTAPPQLVW
jgi:hypothetical protein